MFLLHWTCKLPFKNILGVFISKQACIRIFPKIQIKSKLCLLVSSVGGLKHWGVLL